MLEEEMDFMNKVVIITGASSGIGAAAAIEYAKYGAKLALVGRNVENLKKIADECEKTNGIKPLTIVADVAVVENMKRIVDETVDQFGGIDVLVNNAGFVVFDTIRNIDVEGSFQPLFDVLLRSVYLLTHHALPHLIKSKGNIVNVSSIASQAVIPTSGISYSMAKAALDQFTRIVAYDMGPDGVRVNSVNPGLTLSNIFNGFGLSPEKLSDLLEPFTQATPLRRAASCEDIAHSIIYLSSDFAKNITGLILTSDGGKILA